MLIESTLGKYVIKIPIFDSDTPEASVDYFFGPSPGEHCKIECHYWTTHVQLHRKAAER